MHHYLSFVIIALFSLSSEAQNLMERAIEGITCLSSEMPNQLAIELGESKKTKSQATYQLFDLREAYHSGRQDVRLLVNKNEQLMLLKQKEENILISIPVNETRWIDLELVKVEIFADDFTWQLSSGEGLRHLKSDFINYRGIVQDDHGSVVSLSIYNKEIQVIISDLYGNYRINTGRLKSNEQYNLYEETPTQLEPSQCGTTDLSQGVYNTTIPTSPPKDNTKALGDIVEVYFECDKALYDLKGNVKGVQNYLTSLFAEVATLYANEGITVRMSSPLIWNTNDTYMQEDSIPLVLELFGRTRKNNYSGRLASLISGKTFGFGGVGGIAWVGVLCATNSGIYGPYSFMYGAGRFPINTNLNYSLDVSIITHELGHNFGSPHTHECRWGPNGNQSIDDCGPPNEKVYPCANPRLVNNPIPDLELGTIMSYCDNIDFTKGFGTESGALILNRYQNASCLTPANDHSCTDENKTFDNVTIPDGTQILANNIITFKNTVLVSNGSTVTLSAENQFEVLGTLTVTQGSQVELSRKDCN